MSKPHKYRGTGGCVARFDFGAETVNHIANTLTKSSKTEIKAFLDGVRPFCENTIHFIEESKNAPDIEDVFSNLETLEKSAKQLSAILDRQHIQTEEAVNQGYFLEYNTFPDLEYFTALSSELKRLNAACQRIKPDFKRSKGGQPKGTSFAIDVAEIFSKTIPQYKVAAGQDSKFPEVLGILLTVAGIDANPVTLARKIKKGFQ